MDLWMDLLFGNWVGLLSVITVTATFSIIGYLLFMIYFKSHGSKQ